MLKIRGRLSSIACEFDRWQARPHLERWYRDILAHPASRGVLQLPTS